MLEYPNGEVYAQSNSILRLLGKLHGYYPEDPKLGWLVDSSLDATRDLLEKYWDVQMAGYKSDGSEAAKEKQKKELDEYMEKTLPKYLTVM